MKRLMIFLAAGILVIPAVGQAWSPGSGYSQLRSATGAHLYHKGAEYVQVVELSLGARIKLMTGNPVGSDSYTRQSMQSVWDGFSIDPLAFSVCNGQFFRTNETPNTELAFAVKIDGSIVTGGYDTGNPAAYPTQMIALESWGSYCYIRPSTTDPLFLGQASAPNGIVGLSSSADKDADALRGRTIIGCGDPTDATHYNTFFIYSVGDPLEGSPLGPGSTRDHAIQELQKFGATLFVQFDGGGSSEMKCQGQTFVGSARTIPQTIGILSAQPPDLTPPTTPTNLSVNPAGCSQANSFSFSWTPSTDSGGSGLAGYQWNLDGSENTNPILSSWFTTSAPGVDNYTMFVRAVDGAGNHSSFAVVGFCYQPPTGLCGTREIIGCSNPPHPIIPPASPQPQLKQ